MLNRLSMELTLMTLVKARFGDCWYIASLQAVARSNPRIIEEAITDNGNGTYTVRLYHDGKPVYLTVTGDQVEKRKRTSIR